MTVQPLEPRDADPADLAGCHAVRAACVALELAGDPVPSLEDTVSLLSATATEERRLIRVSREGTVVAGCTYLLLPDQQNTEIGMAWAWVHPDQRRRGHGTALLADAVSVLRAEGRHTLLVSVVAGTDAEHFADRYGFETGQHEILSLLDLSTMDTDWLAAVAGAEHPPYRLESWTGPVPEHLLERYAVALNGMQDAPVGDLRYNPLEWTPERLRDWESWVEQRDRDMMACVAVHEPTGEVAGLTLLLVPRTPNGRAHQDDTTVARAHRGHGLGLWLKAANAQRLLAEHPEVHEISTGNAEENSHMRRINTELGFRVQRVVQERQAAVADVAKHLGL